MRNVWGILNFKINLALFTIFKPTFQSSTCNLSLICKHRVWQDVCSSPPTIVRIVRSSTNNHPISGSRAFPDFPHWIKSWIKLPRPCCPLYAANPLDAKWNNGISCPPYMTSHPPGCWTHVTGLSTTHRTQSRAVHPPSICSSVAPTPLPEFTGIGLLSSSEECDSYLRLTPLPCNLLWKSLLRPDLDS